MGLQGMIGEMVMRCDQDITCTQIRRAIQGHGGGLARAGSVDHRSGNEKADSALVRRASQQPPTKGCRCWASPAPGRRRQP